MSEQAVAALRTVCGFAKDAEDARLLIDALGLNDLETRAVVLATSPDA